MNNSNVVVAVVLKKVYKEGVGAVLEYQFADGNSVEAAVRFDNPELLNEYKYSPVFSKPVHISVYKDADGYLRINTQHFVESNKLQKFVGVDSLIVNL